MESDDAKRAAQQAAQAAHRAALLDTEKIKDWRSIITLIVFVAASEYHLHWNLSEAVILHYY